MVQASITPDVLTILQERFGRRFQTGSSICQQHAATTTWIENQPPEAVVFPQSTEEVAAIVKICAAHRVPLIPFGAGSSLEGQVNAPYGGLCIDLTGMDSIISVNAQDMDCVVQPGVTRTRLNEHLRDTGLFFPLDPGADATIGGMAATRASGTMAVRYGTMRDLVLSAQVVMPSGAVVRTGGRARKSAAGYDLTKLFVGSEGTLGIMTELTLRLFGIPETVAAAQVSFLTLEEACNAVISILQLGVPAARIELLDAATVAAVNAYSKLTLPEHPLLLIELHGAPSGTQEQLDTIIEVANTFGATHVAQATDPQERTKLWRARHDLFWAVSGLRPGCKGISTDVCVPISGLAECITTATIEAERLGLTAPIAGHVGDGNFHNLILVDTSNASEVAAARQYMSWLNGYALSMGGTCTGEHGIGQGKQAYLRQEMGDAMEVMSAIKAALDPNGIMNPGKILSM